MEHLPNIYKMAVDLIPARAVRHEDGMLLRITSRLAVVQRAKNLSDNRHLLHGLASTPYAVGGRES